MDDTTEEENAASFNDGRVTTSNNSKTASPNTVTTPVTESNQTGLPQTGNEQESKLGILGFTCAFVLALMGFSKKKAK